MRPVHSIVLVVAVLAGSGCDSEPRDGGSPATASSPFCDAVERLAAVRLAPPVAVAVDSSMSAAEIDARVRRGSEQLASAAADADAALAALERAATTEVEPDVEVVVAADRDYVAAIVRSGFDVLAASSAGRVGDPQVAAAEGRINEHARASCGVGFHRLASAGGAPGTTSPPPRPARPTSPTPLPPAPRDPVVEPAEQPEAPVVDE